MLIRKAIREDLLLIRVLEKEAETAAHWAEREYDGLFAAEAPQRVALVVTDEAESAQLFGFAIARCGRDEWEIENVVVAGDQRRRGLASALLGELLQEAHRSGATSVLLEVRKSNLAARRLYEKLGFSEIGTRANYYRQPTEDALILKISIAVP